MRCGHFSKHKVKFNSQDIEKSSLFATNESVSGELCNGNMDFKDVIKGRTVLKGVHGEVVGVVSMVADPRAEDKNDIHCKTHQNVRC